MVQETRESEIFLSRRYRRKVRGSVVGLGDTDVRDRMGASLCEVGGRCLRGVGRGSTWWGTVSGGQSRRVGQETFSRGRRGDIINSNYDIIRERM